MEPWRVSRPLVADLQHFDGELDPDTHQSEQSDPDSHKSEKRDPDPNPNPHRSVLDPQHWIHPYPCDFQSRMRRPDPGTA
jgi:hypothetical protein